MSKTTKALAILGVVAGLGVSAMPLSAMAATDNNGVTIVDGTGEGTDGTKDGKVSDTVTVKTSIADTLSLTVAGDNDADGVAGQKHLVLLGTDGVLKNGESATGKASVTVSTNNFSGYKVVMKGANGTLTDATTGATFAAVANNTVTFPTSGDASAFGYKTTKDAAFENLTLSSVTWNAVKKADTQIAANEGATVSDGDKFDINFQAYASPSQAAGNYEEVVTITATANVN